jgi:hypothetical protein
MSTTTAHPPTVKQAQAQVQVAAQKGRPGIGHDSNLFQAAERPLPQPLPPGHRYDPSLPSGVRGPDGQGANNPNRPLRAHDRKSEFRGSYSASTDGMMARMYTVEGQQQGRVPLGADGRPIPLDKLTWIDGYGRRIPYDDLTYNHSPSLAYMWSHGGLNDTSRGVRDAWFNNPNNLTAMRGSGPDGNFSRGSGGMTFRQDVGPNYTRD